MRFLSSTRHRRCEGRNDLIHEGDTQDTLHLLLEGWACRYKQLPDGRRQLVSVFLPGDMCDPHSHILSALDHSMGAITKATFAEVDPRSVEEVCERYPRINTAFRFCGLAAISIQREWTLNLGQRDAPERLGHFLCELYFRQRALGLAVGTTCAMPLTQGDIADALGITNVHVNRTLQVLRKDGYLDIRRRRLNITNIKDLMSMCMFNPGYLHLSPSVTSLDGPAGGDAGRRDA